MRADPGRRAKVQKQALTKATTPDEKAMAKANAFSLCVYIVKTQGLSGLYRGLPMELFRGVLSGNKDRPLKSLTLWRDAASQSREDAMA